MAFRPNGSSYGQDMYLLNYFGQQRSRNQYNDQSTGNFYHPQNTTRWTGRSSQPFAVSHDQLHGASSQWMYPTQDVRLLQGGMPSPPLSPPYFDSAYARHTGAQSLNSGVQARSENNIGGFNDRLGVPHHWVSGGFGAANYNARRVPRRARFQNQLNSNYAQAPMVNGVMTGGNLQTHMYPFNDFGANLHRADLTMDLQYPAAPGPGVYSGFHTDLGDDRNASSNIQSRILTRQPDNQQPNTTLETWRCKKCLVQNYTRYAYCLACPYPEPGELGDWLCTGCNRTNAKARDDCQACGTLRMAFYGPYGTRYSYSRDPQSVLAWKVPEHARYTSCFEDPPSSTAWKPTSPASSRRSGPTPSRQGNPANGAASRRGRSGRYRSGRNYSTYRYRHRTSTGTVVRRGNADTMQLARAQNGHEQRDIISGDRNPTLSQPLAQNRSSSEIVLVNEDDSSIVDLEIPERPRTDNSHRQSKTQSWRVLASQESESWQNGTLSIAQQPVLSGLRGDLGMASRHGHADRQSRDGGIQRWLEQSHGSCRTDQQLQHTNQSYLDGNRCDAGDATTSNRTSAVHKSRSNEALKKELSSRAQALTQSKDFQDIEPLLDKTESEIVSQTRLDWHSKSQRFRNEAVSASSDAFKEPVEAVTLPEPWRKLQEAVEALPADVWVKRGLEITAQLLHTHAALLLIAAEDKRDEGAIEPNSGPGTTPTGSNVHNLPPTRPSSPVQRKHDEVSDVQESQSGPREVSQNSVSEKSDSLPPGSQEPTDDDYASFEPGEIGALLYTYPPRLGRSHEWGYDASQGSESYDDEFPSLSKAAQQAGSTRRLRRRRGRRAG